MSLRLARYVGLAAITLLTLTGGPAARASDPAVTRLQLVSTPESIPLRPDGQLAFAERPGFRAILLRDAGKSCGADVNFVTAPWPRALEMVRTGAANGAFAASYSVERAAFAAFPMRDGAPDPTRAMREQVYHLYAGTDAGLTTQDGQVKPQGVRAIVERSSIGVAVARGAGAEPIEIGGYPSMVRMLAERREPALIGVDQHVQAVLRREPSLGSRLVKLEPALMRQHGYVVFNLAFHDRNRAFADCFWSAVATIRASERYRDLVRSQNDGDFIE
jgi:polar amino acid transport system substrate-binding protein